MACEVLSGVKNSSAVFLVVMPCGSSEGYQCFGGVYRVHFRGAFTLRSAQATGSTSAVTLFSCPQNDYVFDVPVPVRYHGICGLHIYMRIW